MKQIDEQVAAVRRRVLDRVATGRPSEFRTGPGADKCRGGSQLGGVGNACGLATKFKTDPVRLTCAPACSFKDEPDA